MLKVKYVRKSNRVHSLTGMAVIASLPEGLLVLSGRVGTVLTKYTTMNIHSTYHTHIT